MAFTQENRSILLDTPLGKDVLLLVRCAGTEEISSLFSFELEMLSENHNVVFKDIIGKNVTVSILLADGSNRYLNGIISRFSQGRGGGEAGGDPRFSNFTATMVPFFWLLTRTSDSRIFQGLSVPDIVEKILKEKEVLDYEIKLHGSYDKRDYCVQYRETDFNFISRLLEEEGIFYFFKHEDKKHILVLSDVPDEHKPCPKQETARYQISAGGQPEEDMLTSLDIAQEIRVGKYTLKDFNFETPSTDLKVEVPSQQTLGPGEREVYDYPGGYGKRAAGDRLANIRMQEEEAAVTTINGSSRCRAFTSGFKFDLKDYYRDDMNNKAFVLTSIHHEATQEYIPGEEASDLSYINNFSCIPFDVPFRPRRRTPRPVVEGVQTAIVVGPKGEEIYPDEHARVKVQFHWDREGKKDENSSCWIRVSQVWAGAGWGAMHVPHVGHEVIVDFIEGDPDRPIITGRVYDGNNKPPDDLPANKTKNYIQSWGDNDIIFENKDGDKCIHIKQSCGNEIRMHESSPDIEIKQKCGNEVLMKASGPDIEIKQACGNEIFMKASGPDIDIKQACGNKILMHAAEGIHMKDKYGNEVKLDAVAGFIRIASPTHNSFVEIGKSLVFNTDSENKQLISGDISITGFGGKLDTLLGARVEMTFGLKKESAYGLNVALNYSKDIIKNFSNSTKKSSGFIKFDSEQSIHLVAGAGDDAELKIKQDYAMIGAKGCGHVRIWPGEVLIFSKDGKIILKSNSDIELNSDGDIKLNPKGKVKIPKGKLDAKDLTEG